MCIRDYLQSRRVPFEAMLHRPVPSATRRAQSIHAPGRQVAKAVLVETQGRYVLAVLPATHRINFEQLARVLGVEAIRLASEDEIESIFHDCERGAIPPFGKLYGLSTVVDASLAGDARIIVEANMRHEDVRLRYRDYESLESPLRARFAQLITPRKRRGAR